MTDPIPAGLTHQRTVEVVRDTRAYLLEQPPHPDRDQAIRNLTELLVSAGEEMAHYWTSVEDGDGYQCGWCRRYIGHGALGVDKDEGELQPCIHPQQPDPNPPDPPAIP
jgi:hypothetical protein